VSKNGSKSYIKINGFDKIVSSMRKKEKSKERSKERLKNFSKIDYSINTDNLIYPKASNFNILNNKYVVLSRGKTPGISMSTRNLSLDKNDKSGNFKQTTLDTSAPFISNYNLQLLSYHNKGSVDCIHSHNQSCHPDLTKSKTESRKSLMRSKKQPSQKDL
jgi:hypothetical protein